MTSVSHAGCSLWYEATGSGAPVLFIQGTGIHGAGWGPQVRDLSADHACAWFDNRGMGRSQPIGSTSLTVDQMADDAVAVLDALGWARAHVVGHSLGGLIALNLALRARARVRSLALLCTFARGRDVTSPTPWMIWTGMRTRIGTRRQRRRAFLEMVMTPDERAAANLDVAAAELAPLFGHDLADQPPVVMAQLRAMSSYDASPQLQALAGLPTLVASADSDRIARPELGRTMAAAIPGARYVEFASAAHGVPLRRPAEVNAVLRTHLAAAGD